MDLRTIFTTLFEKTETIIQILLPLVLMFKLHLMSLRTKFASNGSNLLYLVFVSYSEKAGKIFQLIVIIRFKLLHPLPIEKRRLVLISSCKNATRVAFSSSSRATSIYSGFSTSSRNTHSIGMY
ncbi:hypothetical protein C5167_002680 [Papaver somniferum]|uniref:Uncharacterized protein n=1 Tax=Papaver somniferum TaxID=3469 RepID=A0A4Y7L2J8_PAPSO|nr:hypothetical protein C5167_002680 [Papaver somniferum]